MSTAKKLHGLLPLVSSTPLVQSSAPPPRSDIRELSPQKIQKTAACAMIEALVEAGVDTFFGIPGGPVIPVFDGI